MSPITMAGKATIPASVHEKIRKMHAQGMGKRAIIVSTGYSSYTVNKAIDPDFAEQEAARHRMMGRERYEKRKTDPEYVAYQHAYSQMQERREQARISVARARQEKRLAEGAAPPQREGRKIDATLPDLPVFVTPHALSRLRKRVNATVDDKTLHARVERAIKSPKTVRNSPHGHGWTVRTSPPLAIRAIVEYSYDHQRLVVVTILPG